MNPDKKYIIDELLERVNQASYIIAINYDRMSVVEFAELRDKLVEKGAECHVAKNTYMKKAFAAAELPEIEGVAGQTAYITGEQDVCAVAKVVAAFAKSTEKGNFIAGILDGSAVNAEQLVNLSKLPSREALLAQLLGLINTPAQQLVRTINEPASSLARVLAQKS